MTKETTVKSQVSLLWVWRQRLKLRAEGKKRWAERDKLWCEGDKRRAERDKLWCEGNKLCNEGDKLWREAVLEAYGNVIMDWQVVPGTNGAACVLATGERFEP